MTCTSHDFTPTDAVEIWWAWLHCRYMVILIFMKWSINWEERMDLATCHDGLDHFNNTCTSANTTAELCPLDFGGEGDGCQPPNLITTLINIALSPGGCDEPMYDGQAAVQVTSCMASLTEAFLSFGRDSRIIWDLQYKVLLWCHPLNCVWS